MTNIESFLNQYESLGNPELNRYPREDFELSLQNAIKRVTPVFDLRNFVAVNPYFGFVDQDFPQALSKVNIATGADVLPPQIYYKKIFLDRDIGAFELKFALATAKTVNSELTSIAVDDVLKWLESGTPKTRAWVNLSFAQAVNDQDDPSTLRFVRDEISKWLAAYYDEGQALWAMPWKNQKVFKAWCSAAKLDRNFKLAGFPDISILASKIETGARDFILKVAATFELTPQQLEGYSYSLFEQIKGWSSFVKYKNWHSKDSKGDLEDLLAILMMVDISLSEKLSASRSDVMRELKQNWNELAGSETLIKNNNVVMAYICQLAVEAQFRNELSSKIWENAQTKTKRLNSRPKVQAVFCIDVRSEVYRRNLEALSPEIETLGFAGFFGLPLALQEFGRNSEVSHLPVLLQPKFKIKESVEDVIETAHVVTAKTRRVIDWSVVKKAKSSAISCFSFVESFGVQYAGKLLMNSLGIHSKSDSPRELARPKNLCPDVQSLSLVEKTALAEGMLRNMGLVRNFAPLVLLLGHGSKTQNNPYASGLDCGACGGNTGELSARVSALILNDESVRNELARKNIHIPSDTLFQAGLHNTTTDDIELYSQKQTSEIQTWIQPLLKKASQLAIEERAQRFNICSKENAKTSAETRSKDWSELRPEWALARNACFIAAPRATTEKINLEGRSFLHNYDYELDPELKTLELIMTAPMVVANWINMQYFASTVDTEIMGSGNKTTQNVVGTFGVVQGNVGDLKIGLSEQSVRLGRDYVHEPLRLQVFIEAPRASIETIIERHSLVKNLVENDWLSIIHIEPGTHRSFVYRKAGLWSPCLDHPTAIA